jgi:hypothetical protein
LKTAIALPVSKTPFFAMRRDIAQRKAPTIITAVLKKRKKSSHKATALKQQSRSNATALFINNRSGLIRLTTHIVQTTHG